MFRLKYYSLSDKLGWRLAGVTALVYLLLGAISFGYGIKLMEYAEKKDITPIFSAIPMLLSGVLGAGVALSRKKCIVACYAISSAIVLMLSIHMNYRFMVKEYSLLPLYRRQCQTESHTNNQHFCQHYTGTVMLCCVSVSMVPVAIGAVLACLVAQKTLNEKNLYLPWFTFSKVEPSSHTNRKIREKSNNNKLVTLVNFKRSERILGEIPPTHPSSEYIPRIPDFMELAIPSSTSPAYKASVTNEFGAPIKNIYSKSLNDLESNANERLYSKQGEKSASNDLLLKKSKQDGRRENKNVSASSAVDLRSIDQNFFSRKNNMENQQYYDNSAEHWIEKMVDNAHSRNRLYGVSDEEDLDSDSEISMDSTTQPFLSKQKNSTEAHMKNTQGLNNKNFSVSVPLIDNEENIKDTAKVVNDAGSPPYDQGSPQTDRQSLSQEMNQYVRFSKRKRSRINGASSPGDLDLDKNIDGTTIAKSDMIEDFSKDITPPGLITPLAGRPSPGGQLHFEFDKVSSSYSDSNMSGVATGHARKNWIEFETHR